MSQFYTLQEAADKLNATPAQVRQLAQLRRIAEFPDTSNPESRKYRRDQIDRLVVQRNGAAKSDATTEIVPDIEGTVTEVATRRALYIGSFDPPTNGHLWVIERGSRMFDELIVGVGINPKKTYTFSLEERKAMLEKIVLPFGNVRVKVLGKKLAARFAAANHCGYLLQGIRDLADYEYQKAARYQNESIAENVDTVLVVPPRELIETSSSFVKGLVGFDEWEQVVSKVVPPEVLERLKERLVATA